MTIQQKIGREGEELACAFLLEKGYQIIFRNYRFSHAEIDIIARDGGDLVFVEVKTRSYTYFGAPETSVGEKKKRLMIDAAHHYIDENDYDGEIRFDIIAIVLPQDSAPELVHYEDAFFPGLA